MPSPKKEAVPISACEPGVKIFSHDEGTVMYIPKVGDRCMYFGPHWRGLSIPLCVVLEVKPVFSIVEFDSGQEWAVRNKYLELSNRPVVKDGIYCKNCGQIIKVI